MYVDTIRNLKLNDYITINTYSNIGEMLYKDGLKFRIIDIEIDCISIDITNNNVKKNELSKFLKLEWCLSKDDVSAKDIFNLHKTGGGSGRSKVAKYCIQDCELCIYLVLMLDIIPNNMGMSSVCTVPLNFIFSRGQGIKVTSVVSNMCDKKFQIFCKFFIIKFNNCFVNSPTDNINSKVGFTTVFISVILLYHFFMILLFILNRLVAIKFFED